MSYDDFIDCFELIHVVNLLPEKTIKSNSNVIYLFNILSNLNLNIFQFKLIIV